MIPPGMASPRSSELASPTRRVSPWPHRSSICPGGASAHSLSKCACLPPRLLGGSVSFPLTPSFGMPIRLDLYAPSERSYIPLQLPCRWRSSCPIPFATSPPMPASPPTSSVTAIPSATSAPLCPAVCLPSRAFRLQHYEDDGVSGTIPLEDRPAGRALARDARVGRFSQVWVVRSDRLGRDAFELLRIWRVFESIGIALRATDENIDDPFYFDIHAVIAANERRKFLERSAEGMNRAASEGRYTGGIVPLGYSVSGDRGFRRLVPDDSPMWAGLSAADVVRRIYHHLAIGRLDLSAYRFRVQLARHPHLLSPRRSRRQRPSHPGPLALRSYPQPRRQSRLQGLLQYGRRSTKPNGREVISASVSPLVSEDVWNAAIATLKRNRAMPRNSCHAYLLRSLIRCGVCGLSFCGTWARGPRYRCNGSMAHRGPFAGKCIGASIKGEKLEAAVWSDVSRFLTDPHVLVDELLAESSDQRAQAVAEAERASLLAQSLRSPGSPQARHRPLHPRQALRRRVRRHRRRRGTGTQHPR